MVPAQNQETLMPNSPYLGVENTGNFIVPCDNCVDNVLIAMCWDGNNPGVAFSDGNTTFTGNLPNGATDPDIVLSHYDNEALVVYELNNHVYYSNVSVPFTSGGNVIVGTPVLIEKFSSHPNVDLNVNDKVAVTWQADDPGFNNDIYYNIGDLTLNGINWVFTFHQNGDNKDISIPNTQLGQCYWPDIAISGDAIGWGMHLTFLEIDGSTGYWHKMEDKHISTFPYNAPNWNLPFSTNTASVYANYTDPRICATRSVFDATKYEMTMAWHTNNSHHVMGINNGTITWVDWPAFSNNGDAFNAVTAWVDDDYINVAWSGFDTQNTNQYDIVVKNLNHAGNMLYLNQWSIANNNTFGDQSVPAIAGASIGLPPASALGVFAYMWRDYNHNLWFKTAPAPNVSLKKEPKSSLDLLTGFYPNPAHNNITIVLEELKNNAQYYIYSLDGQLIYTHRLNSQQNLIELSKIKNGAYTLKIINGSEILLEKLIINH